MKLIGDILGVEKTVTLAEAEPEEVPAQKTYKETPEDIRVDPEELELVYKKDALSRSAILKSVQAIMAAGYKLKCDDGTTLAYFENFIENVGRVGEKITFDELMERNFKYQLVYGPAYWETVLGKHTNDPNNIVDLVNLDPKRIDYAKNSQEKIVLDKYGMPVGYTQKLPFEESPEGKGDIFPEGVARGTNLIFLKPERICHFKFDTTGDGFYALGVIEPAYKSILRKQNIELAQSNSIFQRGTSPIIDYVGDDFHEPTPTLIDNATKKLAKLQYNRYMAFPRWHRLETIEMRDTGSVERTLRYLREDESASLLTAMAIATGAGEATNRSTLAIQLKFLEFCLGGMVKRTLSTIRKFIFARICKYQEFKEVPRIVWGNIDVEEVNDKAKRLTEYLRRGAINPEDVRDYVLESEGLK